MEITFRFKSFSREELDKALEESERGNPEHLRYLCRKEVESFDRYLRSVDSQFTEGLAKFEIVAIEGYLYQKMRGHFDAFDSTSGLPKERKDGP